MTIQCEIYVHSNLEHFQQLFTGFHLLHQAKKIQLSYQILKRLPSSLPPIGPAELLARLNQTTLLVFDLADFGQVHTEILDQVDFYFKRSYPLALLDNSSSTKKIIPLGLTYRVDEKYPSRFELNRILLEKSQRERMLALLNMVGRPYSSIFPKLYRLNSDTCLVEPGPSLAPRAIFFARLWDPMTTAPKYREERIAINEIRAECIRKLRQAFGSQFLGGVTRDEYSARNYRDCLVENSRQTDPGNYIRQLKQCPIGVATTGLHNSIGWKFAEYVAFSRAIVSEKLNYYVPGLEADKHYLEFSTPDGCVEAVSKLMADENLRLNMMEANRKHALAHLRPDILVWNALSIALN